MKKTFNLILAAILIGSASVFTACSTNEASDNPSKEEGKKNRSEFIAHTRKNLKTVAENMNFQTWHVINSIHGHFNEMVLLNDNFDKTISRTMGEQIQKSLKPLSPELVEKWGKKYSATVNLADFDYIFTTTKTGFDVAPNPEDGMIIELINPSSSDQSAVISVVGSGEEYAYYDRRLSNDTVAVIVRVPKNYDIALNILQDGDLIGGITVNSELTVDRGEHDEYEPTDAANFLKDAWNLKGVLKSSVPSDELEVVFNVGQDPTKDKAGMTFDFTQNGRKMIGVTAELTRANGLIDFTKIVSTQNIRDVIQAIMEGNSIDNMQLTLLDDLTTTLKVSDCQKVLALQNEMAHARRNYADQETIEGYVSELNKYISGTMTCKGLNNMQIPMKLQTTKIGVDWWAAPALNFADEKGYVSITDMLDKESVEYGVNIIDHAAEPMQQSIIVVRQLVQALQKMQNAFYDSVKSK